MDIGVFDLRVLFSGKAEEKINNQSEMGCRSTIQNLGPGAFWNADFLFCILKKPYPIAYVALLVEPIGISAAKHINSHTKWNKKTIRSMSVQVRYLPSDELFAPREIASYRSKVDLGMTD